MAKLDAIRIKFDRKKTKGKNRNEKTAREL